MNTFGQHLRLTTFGESHGPAIGGVIDGFPSGMKVDFELIAAEMDRRRPGKSTLTSTRNEKDHPEFLSGISPDGITLGTPIGFIIRNSDMRSGDYEEMARLYRPNHADYTYEAKYGIRDARGGGRASARETANWVAAGTLAAQWLAARHVYVSAALTQVGPVDAGNIFDSLINGEFTDRELRVNPSMHAAMLEQIELARKAGDSVGGKVSCLIGGLPAGIGSPVADKLQARLAHAMMSINAAKGFEYGLGFGAASATGKATADSFSVDDEGRVFTTTNNSGGIQGGISNGMPIFFSVAFKPTPTIMSELPTIDKDHDPAILKARGRHDPCVALRAVPVVEAMARLVVADMMLG